MKSIEKTAKTVDEAVNLALEELGVNRDQVEVEILDEGSRGLLGLIGAKDAVVRVIKIEQELEDVEKENEDTEEDLKAQVDDFLTPILDTLVDQYHYDVRLEDDRLYVDIISESSKNFGIVIGKRGVTLDALQYLLSLALNKNRQDYLKVVLDTENYRAKREKTLIRLADKMAKKAVTYRRPVKLEPMNPFERRIIHSSLQNFEGVRTYSEGKEPYRRIVIEYEKK